MSFSTTTSSNSSKITANNGVVGGKTARACDSCVKKRARWYCAADDAFLCQSCDSSVHSANSLARRHHRLRLKTSSASSPTPSTPTWHRGFTRKARTPRNTPNSVKHVSPKASARDLHSPSSPIVPEITAAAINDDEQLLYRVPIFDPLVAELYNNNNNINSNDRNSDQQYCSSSPKMAAVSPSSTTENSGSFQGGGFLPTEMDLAEFAADVESLLGHGLENECDFGIKGLGFVDCEDNRELNAGGIVKIELDDDNNEAMDVDMKMCWAETSMEQFEVNFEDYEESPTSCGEEDIDINIDIDIDIDIDKKVAVEEDVKKSHIKSNNNKKKKKILLRLNYESVITEWASQGSPWTNGARPDFDPDVTWPDCMSSYPDQFHYNHHYMDVNGIGGTSTILADGGREARVSRYREKRRTRLFSKKIRYEVRKLNAEKRPRMKGRFVKRASFASPSFPMLN